MPDLPSGWTETNLGEVVELKRGYDLPKRLRAEGDVPIISSSGLSGTHNESKVDGPGVVTGRYGTIGELHWVDEDYWPLNTALYVRDFKGNDRKFIYYFLQTIDYFSYSDKAAVPGVNRNHLHKAEVCLPPIEEQRAIASILGALDDKIELNRRMNATLESLARAIFKSWFVDFDPVHVNAGLALTGQMPASSAIPTTHDPKVLDLFPSTFQDSELGPIPEGWTVGTVRELCDRVENGGTPKRKVDEYWSPHEVPWLTSGEVRQSVITKTENFISKEGLENSSAKLWPPLTTVVALYGATAGFATFLGVEVSANQACCALIPKPEAVTFNLLTLQGAFQRLIQQARGSAQQNLSQSIVADLKTLIPSERVLNAFNHQTLPLIEACAQNERESAVVADSRDKLLPQLLAGELPVPAALTATEEALA